MAIDFQNIINDIDNKISQLDSITNANRIEDLLQDFNNNNINLDLLSNEERLFIHSKLHMNYYNKKSPLSREDIKDIHDRLIKLMPNHIKNDKLDD